jgi:hypothetical protein
VRAFSMWDFQTRLWTMFTFRSAARWSILTDNHRSFRGCRCLSNATIKQQYLHIDSIRFCDPHGSALLLTQYSHQSRSHATKAGSHIILPLFALLLTSQIRFKTHNDILFTASCVLLTAAHDPGFPQAFLCKVPMPLPWLLQLAARDVNKCSTRCGTEN